MDRFWSYFNVDLIIFKLFCCSLIDIRMCVCVDCVIWKRYLMWLGMVCEKY